jgi:hypothetical protein
MAKPGPWKRWAVVAHRYDLDGPVREVASPFGGIVYICCDEFMPDKPIEFRLTFSGFARYPLYLKGNAENWQDVKDLDTPWGELESATLLFTLPVRALRQMPDHESTCKFVDDILVTLLHFLVDESPCSYRVVFDVEAPNPPLIGYPIVLDINWIPGILDTQGPSKEWFCLLILVASSSLASCGFPEDASEALAVLAAYETFQTLWPKVNGMDYYSKSDTPRLFGLLMEVRRDHGSAIFTNALTTVREAMGTGQRSPTYYYKLFCNRICKASGVDYSVQLRNKTHAVRDDLRVIGTGDVGLNNLDTFKVGLPDVASFSGGLPR